MRKWLIGLLVVVLLILAGLYFLIPSRLVLSKNVYVSANQNSAYRALTQTNFIEKWWPDSSASFAANGRRVIIAKKQDSFILNTRAFNVIEVVTREGKKQASGFITILGLKRDSSIISWQEELPASSNPLVRLQHYFWAHSLKSKMNAVAQKLQVFLEKEENAYNLVIQRSKVTDTFLVSIKQDMAQLPTTETCYALIKKLKEYIAANGARETGYPMLNINSEAGSGYQVMAAIPVNKMLPDEDPVLFKRMIPGNILMAEVRGGTHTINEGMQQLDYFVMEQGFKSPAQPFQSLVTDRLAERDTAKWLTRLYYPIY